MVASRTSSDKVSPLEQFTGRKIDAKIDLRISFGGYVHAVNQKKDNQVENANTHGCIAVRQTGSLTDVATQHAQFREKRPVHRPAYARRSHEDAGCDGGKRWNHANDKPVRGQ
jgi:hypothetical protein